MVNSLSQLVLKIASPGVPDFYQGSELWNLDLVDPDNRRPVDYEMRKTLLDRLEPLLQRVEAGHALDAEIAEMVAAWHDARIKLFVTASGLRFRRARPGLLLEGDYTPLDTDGPERDRVVAFLRTHQADTLACAVPRLNGHESNWQHTRIALPSTVDVGCFRHVFTGARVDVIRDQGRSWLPVDQLWRSIPVALLTAA
jgi:(1->4)-alpha-D-glucan 1-alpha-D-glucosylmutase